MTGKEQKNLFHILVEAVIALLDFLFPVLDIG